MSTDKIANTYDYQARGREFQVNDFVHPIGTGPLVVGRVSEVWPGIGMVQVEFPFGSERFPVEDVEKILPENSPVIPTRTENVPGGSDDLPSVSAGRPSSITMDGGIETATGKDSTSPGVTTGPGELNLTMASKEIIRDRRASMDVMARRVAEAHIKQALYWHSADRNYRATKVEYENGSGYTCPKCKEGILKKGIYKMRKGQRHRLYICPNCTFVVKQDNIHSEHHMPLPPPPEHGEVLSVARGGRGKRGNED